LRQELAGADPVGMDPAHEARAMAEVQERLEERFPDLDPAVVAAAVQTAAAGITGPVRDFVPVLVERAARERLTRVRAGGGPAEAPGEMTPNGG
jgi:hypothetical protein